MKTVVVLSGGGAKGSMQFGFLKRLVEEGLKPEAIYGTSVGNLNAFGYSYLGISGLEAFWARIKSKSSVFKLSWLGPIKALLGLVFKTSWPGLHHAAPLRKLAEEVIKDRQPSIPCFSCVVNIDSGETSYGQGGQPDYVDYVVASASIPALCEPVNRMVDGGIREQSPLKKAIEDGAEKIVVILCNPWRENPDPGSPKNWWDILIRTTDIMSHEIFMDDIKTCLWVNEHLSSGKRKVEIEVYAPDELVIDSLDFVQEKIQPAIAYGYEQAKKGPKVTSK